MSMTDEEHDRLVKLRQDLTAKAHALAESRARIKELEAYHRRESCPCCERAHTAETRVEELENALVDGLKYIRTKSVCPCMNEKCRSDRAVIYRIEKLIAGKDGGE